MTVAAIIAAGVCILSLAMGFSTRRLVSRQLAADPKPADSVRVTAAPDRWVPLARGLLLPDRCAASLAIWLAFLDAAVALAAPWPLKVVVDYALGRHPFPAALGWLGQFTPIEVAVVAGAAGLLMLLTGAVAGYLVTFLTTAVSERMTIRLRAAIVAHVLSAQPRSIAAFSLGELTSRLGGDAVRVSSTITAVVDTLVPDVALLSGMTAITAILDWRLTLVAGGVIPLYALTARFRNAGVRDAQQRARTCSGELTAFATDLLARLPAVHVFDRARDEASRYQQVSSRAARAEVAAVNAGARFAPVTETLPGLCLATALVAGTVEVTSGRLTLGGFLVFLAYLSSLTGPIRSLTRLSGTIARGSASRDRIAELLRLPPLRPAPGARRAAPRQDHGLAISLDRVSYAHRPGHHVLDSATLDIPAGTLVCLTGPSGCGKSTLLSLLARLADPQSGSISVDGCDISGIPLSRLRALISLVPQDPWLHTGTIAQNIGYGRQGATPAQIHAAAVHAGVDAFASSLPAGYDTPVGEHGRQLSGGQQRRVAVARALLRDTPVLLLDEPTTGLDPATEARLITDLLAVTRGKTVLLVSHQPACIDAADRVVHLVAGHVTETGSPAAFQPARNRLSVSVLAKTGSASGSR